MARRRRTDTARVSPEESVATFGAEVRELRKARQMTLADLAQNSGVSVSHLSAIERGAVNPTLAKITRIAHALDVPEEWFFGARPGSGPLERAYVVRNGNRRSLDLLFGETAEVTGSSHALISSSLGGEFHMGITEYPPCGNGTEAALFLRDGEQHGLVLEGELILTLEGEEILLREGDSFSFPCHILHGLRNESDRTARLVWANAPVIIPRLAALGASGRRTGAEPAAGRKIRR